MHAMHMIKHTDSHWSRPGRFVTIPLSKLKQKPLARKIVPFAMK